MTNSKCVDEAIERYIRVLNYSINPFRCLYFNPNKYDKVRFAKWCQKYMQNRIYLSLLKTTKITGYEVVPNELLMGQAKRDGYSDKRVRIGGLSFYLLKPEDMSKGLLARYQVFKAKVSDYFRSEASSVGMEGVGGVD